MNREIMEGLVSLLADQLAPGQALEGVAEVRLGDPPQATAKHPVVLVSWERDLEPGAIQRGPLSFQQHAARFLVTLFVVDLRPGDAAETTLQDLLLRWESGSWRGLKAALAQAQAFETMGGQRFLVRMQETRRVTRPEAGGRYSLGAAVAVLVQTRI